MRLQRHINLFTTGRTAARTYAAAVDEDNGNPDEVELGGQAAVSDPYEETASESYNEATTDERWRDSMEAEIRALQHSE